MLSRLTSAVAGLLVVLLIVRYTVASGYTECDRSDCGLGGDVLYGAWRGLGALFVGLLAYGLVRLARRAWGRRMEARRSTS